jgi:hypothetical protein
MGEGNDATDCIPEKWLAPSAHVNPMRKKTHTTRLGLLGRFYQSS